MRPVEPSDLTLLRAMLYEAAFWRPDRPRPPIEEALADPPLHRRMGPDRGCGPDRAERAGRVRRSGVVPALLTRRGRYGFVDERTPELSIAIVPEARGRGIGTRLLAALIEHARAEGFQALSLSVESDNPVRALYERLGFVRVWGDEAWTMRIDLG